jgi:hypothetical protein
VTTGAGQSSLAALGISTGQSAGRMPGEARREIGFDFALLNLPILPFRSMAIRLVRRLFIWLCFATFCFYLG